MIETRALKIVIFTKAILSFVLSRKIINIYNHFAWNYGNDTVKDFRKYEKLKCKNNKLKYFRKFEKLRVEKEETKIRHQHSQQLKTTLCLFETSYL